MYTAIPTYNLVAYKGKRVQQGKFNHLSSSWKITCNTKYNMHTDSQRARTHERFII